MLGNGASVHRKHFERSYPSERHFKIEVIALFTQKRKKKPEVWYERVCADRMTHLDGWTGQRSGKINGQLAVEFQP